MVHGEAVMRIDLMVAWLGLAYAARAASDPIQVLRRATQQVIASLREMPNCTCVEDVTRDYYEPAASTLPRACPVLLEQRRHPTPDLALRLFSSDRLRLEVAMDRKGELFSWLGATRFEDTGIESVVRHGPIGSGSFGGYLTAIFETDADSYTVGGPVMVDGRELLEYRFRVARPASHFMVRLNDSWVYVPYSGSFQVDPGTADVIRMSISTGDLPPATKLCQGIVRIELARVAIGESQYLLPLEARERFIAPTGQETENISTFGRCREFRGDSSVTFFSGSSGGANRTSSVVALIPFVPAGLPFSFRLTAPINTATAAGGDPFTAKLAEPIRNGQKIVVPAGSLVEGRLIRVQRFYRHPEAVVLMEPEAVWVKGQRVPIHATRDWSRELQAVRKQGKKNLQIFLPFVGEGDAGVFRFPGEHLVVPAGFVSSWKTR